MYTQTNVGLLCCVGSGSNVAVALRNLLSICCNGRSNVCTVARATGNKFQSTPSPVLGFAFFPTLVWIYIYDLCLLYAEFYNEFMTYVGNCESHMQIVDWHETLESCQSWA